jgi:phage gpG-like protein
MLVKITVSGLRELAQKTEPFRSPTFAHGAVQEGIGIVSRGIKERFDAEVDPNYRPWAALKESTVKRKGGRGKILVKSGGLRNSIRVMGINAMASKVVAKDIPGKFHQEGTPKMVSRPFMGISDKDNRNVESMLRRRLRLLG